MSFKNNRLKILKFLKINIVQDGIESLNIRIASKVTHSSAYIFMIDNHGHVRQRHVIAQ
jgi:hypothetical protein